MVENELLSEVLFGFASSPRVAMEMNIDYVDETDVGCRNVVIAIKGGRLQ